MKLTADQLAKRADTRWANQHPEVEALAIAMRAASLQWDRPWGTVSYVTRDRWRRAAGVALDLTP